MASSSGSASSLARVESSAYVRPPSVHSPQDSLGDPEVPFRAFSSSADSNYDLIVAWFLLRQDEIGPRENSALGDATRRAGAGSVDSMLRAHLACASASLDLELGKPPVPNLSLRPKSISHISCTSHTSLLFPIFDNPYLPSPLLSSCSASRPHEPPPLS